MALSPMMSHYLETKEKYPDIFLFYRLGDFYELFFDDAVKASKLLDLTLTGKDCGLTERAPMCGVPFHAADQYIAKLVSMGEKVAVCEQLEDPKECKGLVKRDVVKIVTAGTITENELLDEKNNNYILSISLFKDIYGLAWSDITTGEFKCQSVKNIDSLFNVILTINPSEIICQKEVNLATLDNLYIKSGIVPRFYVYRDNSYLIPHSEDIIKEHFKVVSIEGLGLNEESMISASGSLLEYLSETQKRVLININKISVLDDKDYMILDSTAIRNLELVKTNRDGKRYGSLLWAIDKTCTPMGSRLMSTIVSRPLLSINKIKERQDGVEELFNDISLTSEITQSLENIKDTERLAGKISNNNITPRDVLSLSFSLSNNPKIKELLKGCQSSILKKINKELYDFSKITDVINRAISIDAPALYKEGGFILDGFDKELDRLRSLGKNSEQLVKDIELRERESTGIKTLKVGYNKVFGYFIEVTNSLLDKVPLSYIRKQTLVGAERFITEELKGLEDEILGAREKSIRLELELFEKIKDVLKENFDRILASSRATSMLDCINSFALVAKNNNYCRPEILPYGDELKIIDGRHPVVEQVSKEQFISNNTLLNSNDSRMMIITGPNMAGKSTYMRQVALITILAHIGSFVPCREARIPLVDKIFTRVGASDNLIFDQSTFMVEMSEVATILNKATKNSLIILDEVGRGTSTFDGLSIAWSVVEYITKKLKAKTLFATHYHELSSLEETLEGVKNYKITVKEFNGSVIFLRKVVEGSANRSFGIEVASLAGVPKQVTEKAKEILYKLETNNLANSINQDLEETTESISDEIILRKIKKINIDELSPREALDFLYEIKKDL